ncbi:hypothetical protein BSL78_16677 [Apostichopus japonicus]|uniref:Ig-like domain-containing protein n=1 Tax=Stichopus japonicus TaxID=307972 RepID=A0A2G8KEN4_STIJA|nr:hypothetical protein BSL78_16677 [Apostichopus japonicus]
MNIRSMTMTNTINVEPSVSQNGTVFTCKRDGVAPVTDIDRCTVGPINVYEKLIVFIEPIVTTTDSAILYPGQTKNYTCSSLPTSSVEWSISEKLDDSGIEVSVIGSKITVTVPSDRNFTGDVDLFCSGDILDQRVSKLNIGYQSMESTTKTPAIETESLLFIVIGASGGFLALTCTVLILCCVCLKCKGSTSPTIKPDPGKQAPIPVPEYDLAPFGSGERQAVPKADENQINGHDPNAAEDGKESYAVVSEKGNENEDQTTASGVLYRSFNEVRKWCVFTQRPRYWRFYENI